MLRPVPTAHPAIMVGSLAIVAAVLYWSLSNAHHQLQWWVSLVLVLGISIASNPSVRSRAKAINQRYPGR